MQKFIEIRKIKKSDKDAFISFLRDMKKDDPSFYKGDEEEFAIKAIESNYTKKGIFLVAKEKGKVIGFCNLFGKEGRAEIGIGVHPKYRNKGIGKRLLQEILNEARRLGIKKIYAGVKKENKNSINFFKRNGFKKIEERETSILLERKL